MKFAPAGTVSHGTLRTEDLLPCFAALLDALLDANTYTSDGDELALKQLHEDGTDILSRIEEMRAAVGDEYYFQSESAEWHLSDVIDLLSAFAPPGHYFGSHVGDGSDFGFWPSEEE